MLALVNTNLTNTTTTKLSITNIYKYLKKKNKKGNGAIGTDIVQLPGKTD